MINRIRDIRRQKRMTLADVAARCSPPTTAQTIGRLETGTRNLSLGWMNRIAAALEVEPKLLLRGEEAGQPRLIARMTATGTEALPVARDAILPTALGGDGPLVAIEVEASAGEYRAGDQLWLRQHEGEDCSRLLNRDVLAPQRGGRFVFGRLIDRTAERVTVLPPGTGQRQVAVEDPAWLAVAEMLVRKL
jgi:transcriptional regulator with XRE-family HTH domain